MVDLRKDQYAEDRGNVLELLNELELDLDSDDWKVFEVVRTNDRKGYRDERPFLNSSPYQDFPKVLIRLEIEIEDYEALPLIERAKEIETIETEAANRARLAKAEAVLRQAQAEYEQAKTAVNVGDK